ncbi:M23 family metallopeptidase [candidate division KSB1 bacterium]|nr:M23 family metallopeptidase [candidate division KSB1 bacterium]
MKKRCKRYSLVCSFWILLNPAANAVAQDYIWPTNASRALTSSFAESRPGRFHAGIDVKTWGREGYPIYAVRDGYVSRIRISPYGYGLALYLTLDTGEVAVYGHLKRFIDSIADVVWAEQDRRKRYSIDLWLDRNRFPVKQGDLLGYTGQSGVGYPHLHFEMRDPHGHPINPLHKGYQVDDSLPPTVRGISVQPLDAFSTVDNDWRPVVYTPIAEGRGLYRLDRPIIAYGKIAFGLSAFDTMDGITNKFSTYTNQLWIDDRLVFQATYDRFPYSLNRQADLDRDYRLRVNNLGNFYKLWRDIGNQLWFYSSREPGYGALWIADSLDQRRDAHQSTGLSAGSLTRLSPGEYRFRIVSIDYWGNEATVHGRLIAAPPESKPAMELPNPLQAGDSDIRFSVKSEYYDTFVRFELQADSDLCVLPVLTGWNTLGDRQEVPLLATGACTFVGAWDLSQEIAYPISFELLYRDPAGTRNLQSWILPVIPIAQGRDKKVSSEDDRVDLRFTAGSLYRDLFLRMQTVDADTALPYGFVGRVYYFEPMDVPMDQGVDLTFECPINESRPQQLGIYTRVGDDRWVFLGNRLGDKKNTISTRIRGLGEFSLIRDDEAPEISDFLPAEGAQLGDPRPLLQSRVWDRLSGLKDEPSMAMFVDGERVVAEFDPEAKRLSYRPRLSLDPGHHRVRIVIEDRCGNSSSAERNFWVLPPNASGE